MTAKATTTTKCVIKIARERSREFSTKRRICRPHFSTSHDDIRPKREVLFATFLWSLFRFDLDEKVFFFAISFRQWNEMFAVPPLPLFFSSSVWYGIEIIVLKSNAHGIYKTTRVSVKTFFWTIKKYENSTHPAVAAPASTRFRFMMNIHQSIFIQPTVAACMRVVCVCECVMYLCLRTELQNYVRLPVAPKNSCLWHRAWRVPNQQNDVFVAFFPVFFHFLFRFLFTWSNSCVVCVCGILLPYRV